MTASKRFDWFDLGYTAVPTVESHYVSWRIVEINGLDGDGDGIFWTSDGGVLPGTTDLTKADDVVTITAKWDGCSHYEWPEGVATHTCDSGRALAALILRVHEETARLLRTA